jgi:cytochrome P450/NADPH-cytochrome P450 reductase
MDKRFNSFYREDMHPFVDVMMDALREAQMRGTLPSIINSFRRSAEKKFYEDIAYLRNICEEMIVHRKKNPSNKKDLLNAMIHGKDPKTGCSMTDQSIIDNMITFLVAGKFKPYKFTACMLIPRTGHETTSSLLAFVFYLLIKNPDAMKLARKEVDDVVGTGPITSQHLNKLPYIEAALKETLRLYPTAPAIAFTPDPDTTEWPIFLAGGKYKLEKGETLLALLVKIHVDPKAYGDDAEEWKPERMFEENFATLPPNSWKVSERTLLSSLFLYQLKPLAFWERPTWMHRPSLRYARSNSGHSYSSPELRLFFR